MDIQRAKEEIKRAVQAYLATDDIGRPLIPAVRQRPILLMGPPGVGKTQIMEQIAQECDIALVAYTITHHTRQSAVGLPFIRQRNYGGKDVSVTEYTMSEIIASIYAKMEATGLSEGILFIDEIHTITSAGESEGAMNAGNILKPALSRGEIQVIGATTFNEYRKYIEKDQALERRFQPVRVEEPSVADTIAVMNGIKRYYEQHHHVQVPADVLSATVTLSRLLRPDCRQRPRTVQSAGVHGGG